VNDRNERHSTPMAKRDISGHKGIHQESATKTQIASILVVQKEMAAPREVLPICFDHYCYFKMISGPMIKLGRNVEIQGT